MQPTLLEEYKGLAVGYTAVGSAEPGQAFHLPLSIRDCSKFLNTHPSPPQKKFKISTNIDLKNTYGTRAGNRPLKLAVLPVAC